MIEYYITRIDKRVCEPHLCSKQNYLNRGEVTHWSIFGDGTGDFEENSPLASKTVVQDYIEYCEEQLALAREYFEALKDDDDDVNQAL